MNKTQAKKLIKEYGLYEALYELNNTKAYLGYDLLEIIERVLDEIPSNVLEKAIKKGTR